MMQLTKSCQPTHQPVEGVAGVVGVAGGDRPNSLQRSDGIGGRHPACDSISAPARPAQATQLWRALVCLTLNIVSHKARTRNSLLLPSIDLDFYYQ